MARANAVMDAPPPRYRVVERDRRLEVIDIGTGRPLRRSPMPGVNRRASLWPSRTKFDGSAQLVTKAFYDDRAPRTIQLDPGSAAIIQRVKIGVTIGMSAYAALAFLYPWLLAPIPFLIQKPIWKLVREPITRWLDRVEREAT